MSRLRRHPNVCSFFGVCLDDNYPICVVTEYVSEGSLFDMQSKLDMTTELILSLSRDAACGMQHIHKENVLHCDLAVRNLLVALQGEQYYVKIGDFGLAHRVTAETGVYDINNDSKLPIRWSAPEVIAHQQFSKASDVWSFGVVVWEMIQKAIPYTDIISNLRVVQMVCNEKEHLSRPTRMEIPDELWSIMESTWRFEPSERPSFEELYQQLQNLCDLLLPKDKVSEVPAQQVIFNEATLEYSKMDNDQTDYGKPAV